MPGGPHGPAAPLQPHAADGLDRVRPRVPGRCCLLQMSETSGPSQGAGHRRVRCTRTHVHSHTHTHAHLGAHLHTFTLTHAHAIPGRPLDSFATSANPPGWSFSAETSGQLTPEAAHPAAGARAQTGRRAGRVPHGGAQQCPQDSAAAAPVWGEKDFLTWSTPFPAAAQTDDLILTLWFYPGWDFF